MPCDLSLAPPPPPRVPGERDARPLPLASGVALQWLCVPSGTRTGEGGGRCWAEKEHPALGFLALGSLSGSFLEEPSFGDTTAEVGAFQNCRPSASLRLGCRGNVLEDGGAKAKT